MRAHTKTRPIEEVARMITRGPRGIMPIIWPATAEIFELNEAAYPEGDTLSAEDVFGDLFKEHGKAGVLLAGLRHREGLTQREFAAILNITQTNLSAMENGKRNIGKELAKRIANKFKLDYRIFL